VAVGEVHLRRRRHGDREGKVAVMVMAAAAAAVLQSEHVPKGDQPAPQYQYIQ